MAAKWSLPPPVVGDLPSVRVALVTVFVVERCARGARKSILPLWPVPPSLKPVAQLTAVGESAATDVPHSAVRGY